MLTMNIVTSAQKRIVLVDQRKGKVVVKHVFRKYEKILPKTLCIVGLF